MKNYKITSKVKITLLAAGMFLSVLFCLGENFCSAADQIKEQKGKRSADLSQAADQKPVLPPLKKENLSSGTKNKANEAAAVSAKTAPVKKSNSVSEKPVPTDLNKCPSAVGGKRSAPNDQTVCSKVSKDPKAKTDSKNGKTVIPSGRQDHKAGTENKAPVSEKIVSGLDSGKTAIKETTSPDKKNKAASPNSGIVSNSGKSIEKEPLEKDKATSGAAFDTVCALVKYSSDPVINSIEDSMRNWKKTVDWLVSFRGEQRYVAARLEGAPDQKSNVLPSFPKTNALKSGPLPSSGSAPLPSGSKPAVDSGKKMVGGSMPNVLPIPANVPGKDDRHRFIQERPSTLDKSGADLSGLSAGSVSSKSSKMLPPSGSFAPLESRSFPKNTNALSAVDYSGDNIPAPKGTDIRCEAYVEIPKGEGYEALISANGQGLLVELGLGEKDAQGKPVIDAEGKQKRRNLKKGMLVKKGDDLGKQNDREQAANKIVAEEQLVVAKKEAGKTLEIEVAELAATVAQSEYYRAQDANRKMVGTVTQEEVVQRAYEWKRNSKSAEKAKYDLEIKQDEVEVRKAQVNAADAQVLDRKLISPIDGLIDDVMQNEGQWLREGDPILRIIRLDKVQISGKIDARIYSPKMVDGREVTIYVQQPGAELREMKGRVSYARQIVESGWYYVYAEVENINENGYWVLTPGILVTMDIHR